MAGHPSRKLREVAASTTVLSTHSSPMTSPRTSLFPERQRLQVSQVTTMAASTSRPLEYLEGLPGMTFNKLYQQPSTALAIFRRMLPDLGI